MRAMRESGVAAIGTMPSEWGCKRLKYVVHSLSKGNGITKDQVSPEGELPCVRYGEIYSKFDLVLDRCVSRTKRECVPNPIVARKGDILFAGTGESIEEIGKNVLYWDADDGIVGGDIIIARHNQDARYLNYYLASTASQQQKSCGKSKLKVVHIKASDIANIRTLIPPLPEQRKIAAYLDHACGKIDALKAKLEAQIADLERYRKSVINEAVTGKNVPGPKKPSGVEWIGDVPEGWKVTRFKFHFSFTKGLNITKADLVEDGVPVISYGQIHSKLNTGVRLDKSLLRYIPESLSRGQVGAKLNRGDVVFADTSEDYEGSGNCVHVDKEIGVYAGYHALVARPRDARHSRYLSYLFQTPSWRSQVRRNVNGIKVFSVTQKVFEKVTIILPSIEEQRVITDQLDCVCGKIDAAIAKCRAQIDDLAAYRKSLIYECVTGKREVA